MLQAPRYLNPAMSKVEQPERARKKILNDKRKKNNNLLKPKKYYILKLKFGGACHFDCSLLG